MRTAPVCLVLLAFLGLLAACSPPEPVEEPGVITESMVDPGAWEAFTCSSEEQAFISLPEPPAPRDTVNVVMSTGQVYYGLERMADGSYTAGGLHLRFGKDGLTITEDGQTDRLCTPGVQADTLLRGETGFLFAIARTGPAPAWSPVRTASDSTAVYWISPYRMRLSPGQVATVEAVSPTGGPATALQVQLAGDAIKRFAEITGAGVDWPLAVVIDGTLLTAPVVKRQTDTGSTELSGLTPDEVQRVEAALQSLLQP